MASGATARGLSFSPVFPAAFQAASGSAGAVVDFNRVRVVLHHADGTVALDTVVAFPEGADAITVSLERRALGRCARERRGIEPQPWLHQRRRRHGIPRRTGLRARDPDRRRSGGPARDIGAGELHRTRARALPRQFTSRLRARPSRASGTMSFRRSGNRRVRKSGSPTHRSFSHRSIPVIATVPQAVSGAVVAGTARGTARSGAQLVSGPADTAILTVPPTPVGRSRRRAEADSRRRSAVRSHSRSPCE